ncbi:hypothetical protein [Saccharopolyspora cebuensis]|uniref:Uncharacterized protein n=1 Tax=Saccharopolyspora cebuensis TaxID=418759 RepID=A0ABV4CFH1_9PSEU
MRPRQAVAAFDSASAMLRVLSRHLHGGSSPALGLGPTARLAGPGLLPWVNRLPSALRERAYAWSGQLEAVGQDRLRHVDMEDVAGWVTGHYPRRRGPAVMIGSTSGASTHLAALAGVPWLPQTVLVPVRHRGLHPDEPRAAVDGLAAARAAILTANPTVGLHHMHDANQDRLMIRRMAYFRLKYRRLPAAYADFLRARLQPGGTVLVADCGQRWPTTTTGERQVFQHGAVGGLTAEEYAEGGPRVARFLAEQGSPYSRWDAPPPDTSSPEAEWGFDPALLPDLARLCEQEGWRLERLRFEHPDTLSAPVARIYRDWYAEHGIPPDRLLVGCFALLDVHLPLRQGRVPYWTTFGTRSARDTLLDHLADGPDYDEIDLGLFSHGTCSAGLANIEDWDEVLRLARHRGDYCGVDREVYPQDFASNVRFHAQLAARGPAAPVPHPAPWEWVRRRLQHSPDPAVTYLVEDSA